MAIITGLKAAGEYLGVSRQYAWSLVRDGKLHPEKVETAGQPQPIYVFTKAELDAVKDSSKKNSRMRRE